MTQITDLKAIPRVGKHHSLQVEMASAGNASFTSQCQKRKNNPRGLEKQLSPSLAFVF